MTEANTALAASISWGRYAARSSGSRIPQLLLIFSWTLKRFSKARRLTSERWLYPPQNNPPRTAYHESRHAVEGLPPGLPLTEMMYLAEQDEQWVG
jgi:hypothetical protein